MFKSIITAIVSIFAVLSLMGCAADMKRIDIGFQDATNQGSWGFGSFIIQKPQQVPRYACDKGMGTLVFKKDGEPLCRLYRGSVDSDGNVTETLEEVSPREINYGVPRSSGDFLSDRCQPDGCRYVNGRYVP